MDLKNKRILRVARAICYTAGSEHNAYCPICDPDHKKLGPSACIMIEEFRREAEAAIEAMKGF